MKINAIKDFRYNASMFCFKLNNLVFRGSKIVGTIFGANNENVARKLLHINAWVLVYTDPREYTYTG